MCMNVWCMNAQNIKVTKFELLENDLTDTVDLACGLLADPAFAEAILYGTPYVRCFDCKRCGWGPGHGHKCPALAKRGDEPWVWTAPKEK